MSVLKQFLASTGPPVRPQLAHVWVTSGKSDLGHQRASIIYATWAEYNCMWWPEQFCYKEEAFLWNCHMYMKQYMQLSNASLQFKKKIDKIECNQISKLDTLSVFSKYASRVPSNPIL